MYLSVSSILHKCNLMYEAILDDILIPRVIIFTTVNIHEILITLMLPTCRLTFSK
jgi:hypothetical protein